MSVSREGLFVALAAATCIPLAFAVYWPRIGDPFVYDDYIWLRAVRIHAPVDVIIRAFTFPSPHEFDQPTMFWRPLADIYFLAARPLGLHPSLYHAANFLLHGTVGALAVVFLWRLTGSRMSALISGLLFVVAPTYDFAVTWISQVSELMGSALMLAALISYHAHLTGERNSRVWYRVALVSVVCTLLSKESTIILLVLLPALAICLPEDLRRRSKDEIIRGLVPFGIAIAIFVAFTVANEYVAKNGAYRIGPHMFRNMRDYLRWMVFPYRFGEATTARTIGVALFLAMGCASALLRQRVLAFLALWSVVAVVPFSGFRFGIELRYTYLASLPFVAFLVFAINAVLSALPRPLSRVATPAMVLVAAAILVVTPARTRAQQQFLIDEAFRYQQAIDSVRTICGPMAENSFVYLQNVPYRDLDDISVPAGINLYYYHVHVVHELPPLAAFIRNKCVIQYDAQAGRYFKVE